MDSVTFNFTGLLTLMEKQASALERIAEALEKTKNENTGLEFTIEKPQLQEPKKKIEPKPIEKKTEKPVEKKKEAEKSIEKKEAEKTKYSVEEVRAALMSYKEKTSFKETAKFLEDNCGVRKVSEIPEDCYNTVMSLLKGGK